jgi:signal transduction histidine kinase
MSANVPGALFAALTRWVTTLTVLSLIARAVWVQTRRQQRHWDPVAQAAWALTAAVVGFCALVLLRVHAGDTLHDRWLYPVLTTSLAAAWFAVGSFAVLRGQSLDWLARLAPVLTSMGVAELLRIPGRAVWSASAALLVASIGVLVVMASLRELMTTIANEHQGVEALTDALDLAREVASEHDEWREELTHDARNALSGLRATLQVLEVAHDRLDQESLDRLRSAAIDELAHLEHMITAPATDMADFDVADVVRTVVDLRRAAGLEVELTCQPATAHGRPADLARVLQNLLVNAQEHGRGVNVSVQVLCTSDYVEIQVADRGPGLSVGADPFARGVRGRRSTGSGLGLCVSRTLMRQQGGDLVQVPRTIGAAFAVRLPKARGREEQAAITFRRLHSPLPVAAADAS